MLEQGKVTPPSWLAGNLHLEVVMGSRAYGCADPDKSDFDIRGIFTPPKSMCFPAVDGLAAGYDPIPACEHWCQPHVFDQSRQREFDFDLHNITKFLRLAEENNPNQVDLLFASSNLITQCSAIGQMLLDHRSLFLSKLCWKRYRGYAAAQFAKVTHKRTEGKRVELVERFGYDTKFAAHTLRLLIQCEMILTEGHLDLTVAGAEMRSIRRGEWTLEHFSNEFLARKLAIEEYYPGCSLPEAPDHARVRELLLNCLEHHYGSLGKVVLRQDSTVLALKDIRTILNRVDSQLDCV